MEVYGKLDGMAIRPLSMNGPKNNAKEFALLLETIPKRSKDLGG